MKTVFELLESFERRPEKQAVLGENPLTYKELKEKSQGFANGIKKLINPGDRIAVWVANSTEWIIINLAVGLAGGVVVPLNMRYKKHEINYILSHSKSKLLIFQPYLEKYNYTELLEDLFENETLKYVDHVFSTELIDKKVCFSYHLLKELDQTDGNLSDFSKHADPKKGFNMLYTSGTTSNPKGAVLSQEMVIQHGKNVGDFMNISEDDVLLGALPFCGIFGFNNLFIALAQGGSILPMDRYKPERALQAIEKYRCTFMVGVDDLFKHFDEHIVSQYDVSSLRLSILAIFTAHNKTFMEKIERLFPSLTMVQPYGMTETSSMIFIGNPNQPVVERSQTKGYKSSKDIRIKVISPDTEDELPQGEEGELTVKGYNILNEYFDNPEKNKESFTKDGYFKTGDLGIDLGNNQYQFQGRMKELLRLKGFLVIPKEIENHIKLLPEVDTVQVLKVEADNKGTLVACVKATGDSLTEGSIIHHCKQALADFKCPSKVIFVSDFPMTKGSNGEKIQKAKLEQLVLERIQSKKERL